MTLDSSPDVPPDVDRDAVQQLHQLLQQVYDGEVTALYEAMAMYETALGSAHEAGASDAYRDISRTYREPLINALDDATQAKGWAFLEEFVDAYHPATADEFPHVTTILQNVTSRYLIRTRLSDDVTAIPVTALDFFRAILDDVDGQGYDFINEGLHPYGWGIGHPDHPVADNIHHHASTDIFVVNALLEHAFYADQHAALDLLERIIHDDSIHHTMPHPTATGEITEARYLLDAPAGAASDFSATMPRYWEWEEELGYTFELAEDVEQRIREIVIEEGIEDDLPSEWEITDLTL